MTSLHALKALAPELQALGAAYGANSFSVFGSVARGTANAASDVDLLVDFQGSPSFEQFMDLKLALEDLLNTPVDLATRRGIRPELRQQIEAEAQRLA